MQSSLRPATLSTDAKAAGAILERWRADPLAHSFDVFGQQCWSRQAEWIRDVWRYDQVTVGSGQKTGKSLGIAFLSTAWISCNDRARVVITAPTYRQLREIIWLEFHRLDRIARARGMPLGGRLSETPSGGWRWPDGREILGFSTNDPNRFSGISGSKLLFFADEAAGVKREIFEAIEGNRGGGGKLVMIGNPTSPEGVFFDSFHDPSLRQLYTHPYGATHRISSEESPNVVYDREIIPGLAGKRWVDRNRIQWGPDYNRDPRYQARVLGQFPDAAPDRVIPLWLITRAKERFQDALYGEGDKKGAARFSEEELEREAEGRMVLGVDVARYGDDRSCIRMRRGSLGFRPVFYQGQDGHELAAKVVEYVIARRKPGEKPIVNVDVIGWGSSCFDALRHGKFKDELELSPINVGEKAKDEEQYANLRTEAWFGLRDWMREGGLWLDHAAESELLAAVYKIDERGRIKLEPKDDMKAKLGRSPDDADAMMLMCTGGKPRVYAQSAATKRDVEDRGIGI